MIGISLEHDMEGTLILEGAGAARPFCGARYQPAGGDADSLEEEIVLNLECTSPAQIAAGMNSLEKYLNLARAASQTLNGKPVYLSCAPAPGEPTWRSRVENGWLEQAGGQRRLGSIGLKLHLRRENAWEGPEACLPLSNPNGLRVTDGLALYSGTCNLYDNYLEIAGADLGGGLPARVRLELVNQGLTSLAYLFCAADQYPLEGSFFAPWFEGEDAAGGVTVNNPACSQGKAQLASWSGTEPAVLLTWALPYPTSGQASGRYFKALLRIPFGCTDANLHLRMCVQSGGSLVWEGAWEAIPVGKELVELNILPLPPYLAGMETLAGVSLSLQARCEQAGSHELLVDLLHLLPLDAWRRLVSSGSGTPTGWTLYDDGLRAVYTGEGSLFQAGFAAYGDGLTLVPGVDQRLYCLWMDELGQAALGHTALARLFYRPRVRII